MKKLILFSILFTAIQSQAASYEKDLNELATNLAILIEQKGFEKIAIWNFQPISKKEASISQPLTDDFAVHFTNATNSLKIYNRQNIETLSSELHLQNSGLMDPNTAKKIGSFTGVEAIITGNYVFYKNKLKLWIKVIETESAFQIAMQNALLSWNEKIYKKQNDISIDIAKSEKKTLKVGKLKVRNTRNLDMILVFSAKGFEKKVKVGRRSKIDVMNLPQQILHCEIYFPSGDLFQESDLKIGSKKNKLMIKGKSRLFRFWL